MMELAYFLIAGLGICLMVILRSHQQRIAELEHRLDQAAEREHSLKFSVTALQQRAARSWPMLLAWERQTEALKRQGGV